VGDAFNRSKLRAGQLVARLPDPIRSRIRGLVRGAPSRNNGYATTASSTPTEELLTEADIVAAYRLFHGREPDPAGREFFGQRVGTWSVREVLPYFAHSHEFRKSETYRILLGGIDNDTVEIIDRGDHKVLVPVDDDAIGGVLTRTGDYEPHVSDVLRDYLSGGATMIDGGANIGILSLHAASLVGSQGRVVAVEALASNATIINVGAALNDFDHLEVIHAALGSGRGSVVVAPASGSNGIVAGSVSGLLQTTEISSLAASEVASVVRLDDIAAGLDRVDLLKLLKLDVEGAEGLALDGGRTLLATHRPVVVMEYSPGLLQQVSKTSGVALIASLLDGGYTLQIIDEAGRVDVGDDISAPDRHLTTRRADHLDLLFLPK